MIALHAQVVAKNSLSFPSNGRRERIWCVALSAILIALSVSWPTRADDDDDDDDVKPVADARQINLTDQSFDQMVFGDALNVNQVVVVENDVRREVSESISAAGMARKRMESLIYSEIRWIELRCRLTEAQKKKLRLAGRGDIESFFSRAAELRAKVVGRSLDQQEYSEFSIQMSLLRMASQIGLLNDTSLFRKTLRRTLDEQQRADYQQLLRQRQLAAVETSLPVRDGVNNNNARVLVWKVSLATRRKIGELIVAEGRLPESPTPYMNYIVLLEADRIAEQIRPLMDDEQWEAFQKLVAQAKRVEPNIRRYAQWPPASPNEDDETKD